MAEPIWNSNGDIESYVQQLFAPEDELLMELCVEAEKSGLPQIRIHADEGRILQILLRSIQAEKVVEIGTLFGYSAIWIARALPCNGRLITLEHVAKHKALADKYLVKAGLDSIVDVRLGEALDLLCTLSHEGPFDLCFIDANWDEYPNYLDWALENVRPGGMIVEHNAYFFGFVALDPNAVDFEAQLRELSEDAFLEYRSKDPRDQKGFRNALTAMHHFNVRMASDPRLLGTIIPTAEGLAIGVVMREESSMLKR